MEVDAGTGGLSTLTFVDTSAAENASQPVDEPSGADDEAVAMTAVPRVSRRWPIAINAVLLLLAGGNGGRRGWRGIVERLIRRGDRLHQHQHHRHQRVAQERPVAEVRRLPARDDT
jgi:hypothetical protein